MENSTYRLSLTGLTGYREEEVEDEVRLKRAAEHRIWNNIGSREKDEV